SARGTSGAAPRPYAEVFASAERGLPAGVRQTTSLCSTTEVEGRRRTTGVRAGRSSTATWREPVKLFKPLTLAAAIAAAATVSAHALDIAGAGATFPYPIYAKWADAYKKEKGVGLNYQSIGSGGGIKQITARTVTFGASDMPLQQAELDKIGCLQFPT